MVVQEDNKNLDQPLILKQDAILIADAHYNEDRNLLCTLLNNIKNGEISTTQIILLGDIFDLLIGGIKETLRINKIIIDLLNELSNRFEIVYFEGNHDFNIRSVFDQKIVIVPIFLQPKKFLFNEKIGYISHGDWDKKGVDKYYSKVVRNRFFLNFANIISGNFINDWIIKTVLKKLKIKKICSNFENFENFIKNRNIADDFICDYFIEGHFHQGKNLITEKFQYINLPSFACNQSYLIVESNQEQLEFGLYKL